MLKVNVMKGSRGARSSSAGQTLIEVIVAFSVAIILIAAIASAVLFALSNAQYGKSQNVATQYAQEGMEIVRKLRDSGASFDEDATYCLPKDFFPKDKEALDERETVAGAGCALNPNIDGIFVREISTIANETPKCSGGTKVTSSVFWSDSKCEESDLYCHRASLESCLSGFSTVSTPGVNPTIFSTPTPSPTPTIACGCECDGSCGGGE